MKKRAKRTADSRCAIPGSELAPPVHPARTSVNELLVAHRPGIDRGSLYRVGSRCVQFATRLAVAATRAPPAGSSSSPERDRARAVLARWCRSRSLGGSATAAATVRTPNSQSRGHRSLTHFSRRPSSAAASFSHWSFWGCRSPFCSLPAAVRLQVWFSGPTGLVRPAARLR